MEKITFVIPCYRSEKIVSKVIDEIISTVTLRKDEYDYEIIAVNDNSPDNVWEVLKSEAEKNNKISLINFAKNSGKHAALLAGFKYSKGDYVVCIDDDMQCPMDKFWDLFEPLKNDYDVSIAKYGKKNQSAFKNFGSKLNALMMRTLIDKPKELQFANFIVMKKFVVDEMVKYNNPYPYVNGLILRTTKKIANVPMKERSRDSGVGGYNLSKSLKLWINGFTSFSVKPLRVATTMGFICSFLGVVYGCYIVINKLMHPSIVMGYSSIVSLLLFISGLLMLMLGMIGEYLGRIYICINNSPIYVIKEKININDEVKNEV